MKTKEITPHQIDKLTLKTCKRSFCPLFDLDVNGHWKCQLNNKHPNVYYDGTECILRCQLGAMNHMAAKINCVLGNWKKVILFQVWIFYSLFGSGAQGVLIFVRLFLCSKLNYKAQNIKCLIFCLKSLRLAFGLLSELAHALSIRTEA